MIFKIDREPMFIWRVTRKKYGNAPEYLKGLRQLIDDMYNKLVTDDKAADNK